MLSDSGIYSIENKVNGKIYIGSAVAFKARFAMHRSSLKNGKHHSIKLQRAWNKYGADSFAFKKLIMCRPDDLLFYEQRFLDAFECASRGYNVSTVAGSRRGVPSSEETKKKISKALIGNSYRKGIPHSDESKRKMAQARIGRVYSPQTRLKIGLVHKGKVVSEETKKKMSDGRSGRIQSNSKSGHVGVYWNERKGRWKATMRVDGVVKFIGYFKEIDLAVQAIAAFKLTRGS